jgi:hypothetical protein
MLSRTRSESWPPSTISETDVDEDESSTDMSAMAADDVVRIQSA